MPDQAAEPLLQRQDRQRHLVLRERIAAARADLLESGRQVIGSPGDANGILSTIHAS